MRGGDSIIFNLINFRNRIITFVFSILVILSLFSVSVLANDIDDKESDMIAIPNKESPSFSVNAVGLDDRTGVYEDFNYSISGNRVTITEYVGNGGLVIIPSEIDDCPVTYIGQNAFYGKSAVTSIILPNTITYLYSRAFYNCSGLSEISLPNSVRTISGAVFYGCTNLTSISMFSRVQSIGSNAFYNCSKLSNVYYSGSQSDWESISIDKGNECLSNATIFYHDFSHTSGKRLLDNYSSILTSMLSWVGTLVSVITDSPILILIVIGSFSLIAIGIIRRLFII